MDRRAAAGLIFAAPAAAFASAGDSPKQSYFGAAPLSAPFGETYTNRGSNALWTELGDTEREIFTRIARKTKEELEAVSPVITVWLTLPSSHAEHSHGKQDTRFTL